MFVGHFAVALAAKRVTPRLSLPLLFGAVQLLDILWPLFMVLGVEHARIVPGLMAGSPLDLYDIPYSHSLVMSLVWSLLVAAPFVVMKRAREAAVLAVCVFSHFILDLITHRPDLPLAPGSNVKFGLGLWNFPAAEVAVEAAIFLAGIVVYLRATTARKRIGDPSSNNSNSNSNSKMGTIGFAVFMLVLGAVWLAGMFGPPPHDVKMVVWSILLSMPFILLWAYAIDRARSVNIPAM